MKTNACATHACLALSYAHITVLYNPQLPD